MADKKLGLRSYHIHVLEERTEFDKQYVTFSVSCLFIDSNGRPTDILNRVLSSEETCFQFSQNRTIWSEENHLVFLEKTLHPQNFLYGVLFHLVGKFNIFTWLHGLIIEKN